MQGKSTGKRIWRQMRFELIEVLIVVSIIGLLTSIGIPLYRDYVSSTSNSTEQSGLKMAKTNLAEHSVEEGHTYFQVKGPTGVATLALDFESSDHEAIAYTGTNVDFEVSE